MKFIDTQGSKDGRFVPGDPKMGERPTRLDHTWCNMIQDEIANVILRQRMTLDQSGKNNWQLSDAIKRLSTHGVEYDTLTDVHDGTGNAFVDTPIKFEIPDQARIVLFMGYIERHVGDKPFITIYDGASVRKTQGIGWDHSPLIRTLGGSDDIAFDIGGDGTLKYSCIKLGNDRDPYHGILKISQVRFIEV
jgi:hypothetical protein